MFKKLALCGTLALATCLAIAPERASAQQPSGGLGLGYSFGVGLSSSYIGQSRSLDPHYRPPYFALFPPVYYSDVIVRRPYGISPFAAPPGIRPVEMDVFVAPEPVTVVNPYYSEQPEVPLETSVQPELNTTSTSSSNNVEFVINPFFVEPLFVNLDR